MKQIQALFVVTAVILVAGHLEASAAQAPQGEQAALESPVQLQQLVAPIALYPDALVAQILAASTYPTQIVEANRWLQRHQNLQGEPLAAAVNQQPWDPSVKALTAFPTVLANLDQNISWTTSLGEVYFNQQQDVRDAVQFMRQRAEGAGNLRNTAQERVTSEGTTIVIEPATPDVCYLPSYDPWLVYGAPIAPYPGFFFGPWIGPAYVSFGPAINLGFFGGFGWGWPAWGFNWGRGVVLFNRFPFVSHGPFIGPRGALTVRPGGFPARRVFPGRVGDNFRGSNFRFQHDVPPSRVFGMHRWSGGSGWHGGSGSHSGGQRR
jgi:hypothetical protein